MLSKNEVIDQLNHDEDFIKWPKLEMLHGAVVLDRVCAPEFEGWQWEKVSFVDSVRLFNEKLAQSIHQSDIVKFASPAVMTKSEVIIHMLDNPAFTKWPDDLDSYGNVKACVEPDGWFWRYHLNLENDVVIALRSRDTEFEEVHESDVPLTKTKTMTKKELINHLCHDPEFTEWPSGPEWASDQYDAPDGWFWYTGINKFTVLKSGAPFGEHVTEHDVFHDIHVGQVVTATRVDDKPDTLGVVYIAGPMTGLTDFNRPAFRIKARELLDENYQSILSPHILPDGLTQAQYMDICLAMVRCADTVAMLEGWERSPGARIEHALAEKSGKRIEYSS